MDVSNYAATIGGILLVLFGVTKLGLISKRSKRLVDSFGETGARVFYIIIGLIILYFGISYEF